MMEEDSTSAKGDVAMRRFLFLYLSGLDYDRRIIAAAAAVLVAAAAAVAVYLSLDLSRLHSAAADWGQRLARESKPDLASATFLSATAQAGGRRNQWRVSGEVQLAGDAAEPGPLRYSIQVKQVCDQLEQRECWRLESVRMYSDADIAKAVAAIRPGSKGAPTVSAGAPDASQPPAPAPNDAAAAPVGERSSSNAPNAPDTRVMLMQAELRERGLYSGKADGKLGPLTHAALLEFLRLQDVPTAGRSTEQLIAAALPLLNVDGTASQATPPSP